MARTIVAFTRDLRLDDHAGLAIAGRSAAIVPVAVVDPIAAARLRSSPRRAAYYCGALAALEREIAIRGGRLIVRRGRTGVVLRSLARAVGASGVVWTASYDAKGVRADRDVQELLEEAGIRALIVHDAPSVAPEETGGERRGYRAFVPYFERWQQQDVVPYDTSLCGFERLDVGSEPLPVPAEFGSRYETGEGVSPHAVRTRFERYLESEILHYALARNAPADGETSHLSAPLSFGLIGARTVAAEVRSRRNDPLLLAEERLSLSLFLRALAQRDFFLQLAYFFETLDESPLQEKMRRFHFERSHASLDAWRAGRTGYPLVDAGVRELRATGWMHPRLRAIVASFLCFDLGVDWRVGRDEWERWLIEDEPALSTGNWQWIAGVGADLAAYPRIYNPVKQARRFDPAGRYIRRWIPEVAARSDRALFEPEIEARRNQLALPIFGEQSYPAPVIDHDVAARAFLERYKREVAVATSE
ncbi:MAG: deoxyribodipyrimidine photo-lyase [Candidatus Eremiobacteraeota bacterium]|nr:deoxyribodipyrimidine photo-lyase [Candidatus Eremiobacteraeota bacterium]